ncbi:hypothetical protein TRFO_06087 [Tritrichomonas foetus]|uniref:Tubby C-terminal domain-containing protein n=1 Tax=Tritrichomonas foetus TaxID=1144522 RepID=A0A1J4K1H0_9EUKA|nr:hypothetical protein TRFO_06087 [Tritrichomonas foetus]|eukprot:OHT05083.1 hypothetical protein TRFO_06087 [Tritrichomonas foetus]
MSAPFHFQIVFTSSSSDESDSEQEIELKPAIVPKVLPPRQIRSSNHRPCRKMVNSLPQRPKTSDNSKSCDNNNPSLINCESPQICIQNCFEIHEPEFIKEKSYIIEMKNYKSLFESTSKRFIMIDNRKFMVYDLTIQSKDKTIELPNNKIMEISSSRTEFKIKTKEEYKKELMRINFHAPYDEDDECKRRTSIYLTPSVYQNMPSKLISLRKANHDTFNGHFFINSIKNAGFVIEGSKKCVFSILEIRKRRIEIHTTLNLEQDLIFALGIASFLGKTKFTNRVSYFNEATRILMHPLLLKSSH